MISCRFQLVNSSAFKSSQRVSVYLSTEFEVGTIGILKRLFDDKKEVCDALQCHYRLLTLICFRFLCRVMPAVRWACWSFTIWTTTNRCRWRNGTSNSRLQTTFREKILCWQVADGFSGCYSILTMRFTSLFRSIRLNPRTWCRFHYERRTNGTWNGW